MTTYHITENDEHPDTINQIAEHIGHQLDIAPNTDGSLVLRCLTCNGESMHRWNELPEPDDE